MHYLIKPISIFFIAAMLLFNGLFTANGQDLVIKNINIIDVETGILSENMDIVVNKSMIQSISQSNNENTYQEGTRIIDGTGKYLTPGFIDTHIHIAMGTVGVDMSDGSPKVEMNIFDEVPDLSLRKLLANGVTTARDPGGKTEVTTTAKKQLQNGKLIGPELFVAGTIIDTTYFKNLVAQVKTDEDIRRTIKKQHQKGVDYIKMYTSLSPDQLEVGINEAHKLGLGTIAHLENTSWTEAARRGIDNIVHIIPGSEQLLPIQHREEFTKSKPFGTQWYYRWFEYVDLNSSEISEMMRTLKEHSVSVDPTLVLFHSVFFGNKEIYQQNPALKYVPSAMVEHWSIFNFNFGWSNEDYQRANAAWNKVESFTRQLHENGIMLTAGTDTNNPFIVPGESFHRELKLLADTGISNSDVLKIATLNGAKLLGIDHRTGTIREGKEADLVILNRNPLDDISNTRHLDLVIMNGQIYNPEDLIESRY